MWGSRGSKSDVGTTQCRDSYHNHPGRDCKGAVEYGSVIHVELLCL